MTRKLAILAALIVILLAPASAKAYWPYLGYGGMGAYGWGINRTTDYVPSPPYFAMYPPVYYNSQITARHYGTSPFAWSVGMQPITYVGQPEAAPTPEPLMIYNPYVPGAKPAGR